MEIIYGASGSGKSRWLYQELTKIELDLSREARLIVPEQFTLEAEQDYLQATGQKGIFSFEITSFSRLIHQIVEAYQPAAQQWMNDLGKILLLDQVLERAGDEVGDLKRLQGKPRLIQEFYRDLMDGKWASETLEIAINELKEDQEDLADKLQALRTLLVRYEMELAQEGLVDEVVYTQIACELIRTYRPFQDAVIWIDQFWGFSLLELEVLEAICEQTEFVYLVLTKENGKESSLFEPVEQTILALKERWPLAKLSAFSPRAEEGMAFQGIKEMLMGGLPSEKKANGVGIALRSALNREEEVRFSASKIRELHQEGIPYESMQLVVSEYEAYLPLIRRIFHQSAIPVHLDHNRKIADFPAAQAVLSLLRFYESRRYVDLFAALKAGYFFIKDELIDRLEIVVTQRGWIYFGEWQLPLFSSGDAALADQVRKLILANTPDKRKLTSEGHWEKVKSTLKAVGYFEEFRKRDQGMNQESNRMEHQSIWRGMQDAVEQMHALHREKQMSRTEFIRQFVLGCELIRVGVLPAICGEVMVRDLIRSRSTSKRITLFLGVNEGKFPLVESQNGFFDFDEREELAKHELKMGSTQNHQLRMQELAIYQIVATTKEQVLFLWSRKNQNYEEMLPAAWIRDLELWHSNVSIQSIEWKDLLLCKGEAMRICRRVYRKLLEGQAVSVEERSFADRAFMGLDSKRRAHLRHLLHYGNQVEPLSRAQTEVLFDGEETSITELERQNQCPFAHFVAYGLKPFVAQPYRIQDPDVGQVMHDLLEMGFQKHLDGDLDPAEMDSDFDGLADQYFEAYREGIFRKSNTSRYIERQVRDSVEASLRQLIIQNDASDFTVLGQEVDFGLRDAEMKPLQVVLTEERTISLRGRIDRLDLYSKNQETFLRVIDYKSGKNTVDPEEMHAGIQLQLPAYMNVFQKNHTGLNPTPAGMFYYYIDQPLPLMEQGRGLEKQIREFYKMQGMFLGEGELIAAMDRGYQATGIAESIPAKRLKNGNIQRGRGIIDRDQMDLILKENLAHIERSVREIHQGDIQIYPYRSSNRDSCKGCSYGGICQFDEAFFENASRERAADKKEDGES